MATALPPPSRDSQAPETPSPTPFSWHTLLLLGLMLAGMWFWRGQTETKSHPLVDYSVFYQWVEASEVNDVVFKGTAVDATLKAPKQIDGTQTKVFHTIAPARDDALIPLLRDKHVKFKVTSEEQPFAVQLVLSLLPWALILGVWLWLSRRAQKMMTAGGPLGGILKPRAQRFEKRTAVAVRFEDVAGLQAAKRDLQEVVEFLKAPEKFRRLGGKIPRGVLLVGPPGTGKTLLARAVAGESGVPFYSISASEFIEMFVGVGAARVRDLFDEAKKNAPAIVFIDEIDAVGRSRGAGLGGGHDEREQTLNQLLSEMDGFARNDLTIVIAATNRPDVLDPALLRPGRFDRHVVVDRPELGARRAILDVHVRGKPLSSDVKLDVVARSTPGFSGADLANLVNEAALHATRRNADSIQQLDFDGAFDKIVLGDPREAKLLADEKRRVAAHEAGHAVLAAFAPYAEPLERVSIIPRGMALGVTRQTPLEDRHLMTQPEIEARLCVLMGGYAAEKLIFGSVSNGAESDLKQASELALKMVAHYGMSPALGPVYYEHHTEHPFLGQKIATDGGTSDATIRAIELEAREQLAQALETAGQLLKQHERELLILQRALVDTETLEKSQVEALWASPAPARVA